MSNSAFPMGSIWRKWDLHVHSPASILNNQFPSKEGEKDWEAYISKLEETDIAVLGVTDYFTIEGYKRILRSRERSRLAKIDLVLPNIEFRLNEILYRNSDGTGPRRLNLHVIFSNELSPEEIEDHFLHNLFIESRGNVNNKSFRERLKQSNLEELGRQLKKHLPDEHGRKSDLIVGAENATVSLEDIKNELSDSGRFKDKYIVVMDEANTELIKWGSQDTQTRLTLLQNSHMVFSSNQNTREWCLGRSPWNYGREQYISTFNSLKPCIKGSDAHELFFIGHPCGCRERHDCKSKTEDCDLRFCWIKADPTFEGLRQVMYEPEDRVCIKDKNPTRFRDGHTFSRVSYSQTHISSELTVACTDLPLHRGLVAVTGGKGAGKTAFVDLIANCFSDRNVKDDKNSFVRRISYEGASELKTVLKFAESESFTKHVTEEKYIDIVDLSYIRQGELDTYIGEGSSLENRVNELILKDALVEHKREYEETKEIVTNLENQIKNETKVILELEDETSENVFADLDNRKRRADTELVEIKRQLAEQDIDDDDARQADTIDAKLTTLRDKESRLKQLSILILDAARILDEELTRFNEHVDSANKLLKSLDRTDLVVSRLEPPAKAAERLKRIAEHIRTDLKKTRQEIDASQEERDELNEHVALRSQLLGEETDIEERMVLIQADIKKAEERKGMLSDTLAERANRYKSMLQLIQRQREGYATIIRSFFDKRGRRDVSSSFSTEDVLNDVEFEAEIRFQREQFIDEAKALFHERRVTIDGDDSDFCQMIMLCEKFAEEANPDIDALVKVSVKHADCSELRGKMVRAGTSERFCALFLANYFRVQPILKYRNTHLDRLSLGQKATVLIKIHLAQGRRPIIIDSHDDHLDNHFIMEELIPAIREAKKHRQVIMVSNNANVVVNADAEQIIIAEHEGNTISYVSGSLENHVIREKVLRVLEGGKEAFKKRQEKYRMN